jgi:hypothetical protein
MTVVEIADAMWAAWAGDGTAAWMIVLPLLNTAPDVLKGMR